jgi:hypothetical protein
MGIRIHKAIGFGIQDSSIFTPEFREKLNDAYEYIWGTGTHDTVVKDLVEFLKEKYPTEESKETLSVIDRVMHTFSIDETRRDITNIQNMKITLGNSECDPIFENFFMISLETRYDDSMDYYEATAMEEPMMGSLTFLKAYYPYDETMAPFIVRMFVEFLGLLTEEQAKLMKPVMITYWS